MASPAPFGAVSTEELEEELEEELDDSGIDIDDDNDAVALLPADEHRRQQQQQQQHPCRRQGCRRRRGSAMAAAAGLVFAALLGAIVSYREAYEPPPDRAAKEPAAAVGAASNKSNNRTFGNNRAGDGDPIEPHPPPHTPTPTVSQPTPGPVINNGSGEILPRGHNDASPSRGPSAAAAAAAEAAGSSVPAAPADSAASEAPAGPASTLPPLCPRERILHGKWMPVRLPNMPYLPPSNDSRCRGYVSQGTRAGHWDTYRWVPTGSVSDDDEASDVVSNNSSSSISSNETCRFTEWNKDMFCQLAKGATVMILGDSLSWEHYTSLALLLLPAAQTSQDVVPIGYQRMSWHANANIGHAVCDGLARMVYRRDDYLSYVREALLESESHIPQVLVLNRGAHYANDTELLEGIRSVLDAVEEWLERCNTMKIKCHFFWRTTVPGHPKCRTFQGPVNDKAKMERHIADRSHYLEKELAYRWDDFQRQNLVVEAELAKRSHVPHQILDGYHINVLRPDGHKDCLHSCYPGKMDVYAQLLLHYLRSDRTLDDVQRLEAVVREQGWDLNVTTAYNWTGTI